MKLTTQRTAMLDIIGFDWREGDKRGNETSLELRTEELEEYRPTTNNTNIEALTH